MNARDRVPLRIHPMLATLVPKLFDRPGWAYEEKYDGYRFLAYKQGAHGTLSRNAKDRTQMFSSVVCSAAVRQDAADRRHLKRCLGHGWVLHAFVRKEVLPSATNHHQLHCRGRNCHVEHGPTKKQAKRGCRPKFVELAATKYFLTATVHGVAGVTHACRKLAGPLVRLGDGV
jgi:hypothetical protein